MSKTLNAATAHTGDNGDLVTGSQWRRCNVSCYVSGACVNHIQRVFFIFIKSLGGQRENSQRVHTSSAESWYLVKWQLPDLNRTWLLDLENIISPLVNGPLFFPGEPTSLVYPWDKCQNFRDAAVKMDVASGEKKENTTTIASSEPQGLVCGSCMCQRPSSCVAVHCWGATSSFSMSF